MACGAGVADKSQAQRVKGSVDALKKRDASPSGWQLRAILPALGAWYESLVIGGRFQVKRIDL